MKNKTTPHNKVERLRVSPNFNLTFTFDGRPYIAKDTEPYIQYWLNERERIVLSAFSSRHGASVDEAIGRYFRYSDLTASTQETKRIHQIIQEMRDAEVLLDAQEDVSRYSAKIVADYVKYRPFPQPISDFIINKANIQRNDDVLDLAGGPGDLALAMASASDNVAMMDLSKGFVNAAKSRAKKLGLNLKPIHDSCNRLVYRDESYHAITISQALHWMDDVMVCRGVCRLLNQNGSFFVIHSAMNVDETHPLAYLIGNHSILGKRINRPFNEEAQALMSRVSLLFEALDAPDVQRVDLNQAQASSTQRIKPVGMQLFRQNRAYGIGYLRGFLTPAHIAITGMEEKAFWQEVENRCKGAADSQFMGWQDWAVMEFKRGGQHQTANSESDELIEFSSNIPLV